MIKILLADDHSVLRSGLKLLLESQADFRVIGEASSGLEALDLAGRLRPDLILLDLSMPGLGGLDALPALNKICPAAKILILTMHDDSHYLHSALKNGAMGYVLKKAADAELISAIRAVLRGEMYVHPALTRALLDDMLPKTEAAPDAWETLSEREREVLRLVALGHTSAEIAAQLHLSDKTVETYRARGMEKLGLPNRAALVRFALKKGILGE
jgi:two-component system response regulator NreC